MSEPSPATAPMSLPALLSIGNFVVGMGAFVVIGVLVPIADDLRLDTAAAGWVMTAYALAYAVASPVLTALTGHIDRRMVLLAGFVVFIVGSLVCALAETAGVLYAGRALAAAGAGLYTPGAAAVAIASAPVEARGKVLATVFAGLTLAQVLGVPAGAWLGYTFGWRTAFFVVVGLGLVVTAILAVRLPAGIRVAPASLSSLGRVLVTPSVSLAILFTGTFLGGVYVVYTYLAPLVEAKLATGRSGVTVMLTVFGLGAVVGNVVGGFLTDRIGPSRTLLLLCGMQIVMMPIVSLLPYGLWLGAVVFFVWAVFGWSFMVPQQARIVSIAPADAQVILSLNSAIIYLAASVGSLIGGAVLAAQGLTALGPAGAAIMAFAIVHLVWSDRLAAKRG
jgi:MFS transporter, DHA1 family, inner membrane transport protein